MDPPFGGDDANVGVAGDDANGGGGVPHARELLHDLALDRFRQLAMEVPDGGLLRGGLWSTSAKARPALMLSS